MKGNETIRGLGGQGGVQALPLAEHGTELPPQDTGVLFKTHAAYHSRLLLRGGGAFLVVRKSVLAETKREI